MGDDPARGGGLAQGLFVRSGDLLRESLVRARDVEVLLDVLAQDAAEVILSQDDHVVQALLAQGSEESLADRIQVGRLRRDLHQLCPGSPNGGVELGPEFRVVVSDQEARPFSPWRRLADLLGGPLVGGAPGDVEVHDLAGPLGSLRERLLDSGLAGQDRIQRTVWVPEGLVRSVLIRMKAALAPPSAPTPEPDEPVPPVEVTGLAVKEGATRQAGVVLVSTPDDTLEVAMSGHRP